MGDFLGKNTNAASDAASAQNAMLEKAIAEQRRQFGETQKNLSPFIHAGSGQLDALTQGTTAGGLDARLAEIFNTDTFGSLVDERTRSVQGQLGATGLSRSGSALQQIANVPTDIGLQIEQMLTGRSSALAGQGLGAATGLGQFGAQAAGNIGQSLTQQGVNTGSGIIGDAQAGAAQFSQILNGGLSIFSALPFSDPRLKMNTEKITELGPLDVYQWDWIPESEGTIIAKCPTIGFMTDEVSKIYPDRVKEFGGWFYLDYDGVFSDIERDYKIPTHVIEAMREEEKIAMGVNACRH